MATIRDKGPYQWQAIIRRVGFPQQSKTFERKVDAEQWARNIEGEMDRGIFVDRSPLEKKTFGDLVKQYGEEITPAKRGGDKEQSKIKFLKTIKLAKIPLIRIEPADIVDFRIARLKQVSASTVIKEMNLISNIFAVAISEWRLRGLTNPVLGIRRPPAPKGRDRRLESGEEMERIIDASESSILKILIPIAVETAMRRGEMVSIKWRHVNLANATIRLFDTKNGEDRTVPLSVRAVALIKGIKRDGDEVFGIRPNSVTQAFTRARNRARKIYEQECKDEGIAANDSYLLDLRLHDMRHEGTSRLVEKGLSVSEVSEITGHKDLKQLKRYTHLRAHELAKKLG